jgi:hypothetical protein
MCTVTYIPPVNGSSFILTSNRDERVERQTAPPAMYAENGSSLWFPRDMRSGGSWIAINEEGRLCCLLNGAFVPHEKQEYHTLSRGKILMEMAAVHTGVEEYFQERDLSHVEPFTVLTIEHEQGMISHFSESIWDGAEKHYQELDRHKPAIWSSVTLYGEDYRYTRGQWFQKFYKEQPSPVSPEKVYGFHTGTHTNNAALNVIMQREGGLKTLSITQVTLQEGKMVMKYTDLIENKKHEIEV